MKKGEHGTRLLALALALLMMMTYALAEEAAAPEAEAVPAEAEVFMLEGDGPEAPGPAEAPAAEAASAEIAEAEAYPDEDMPIDEPLASAEYTPVSHSITVSSSDSAKLYIGDTLAVTYSRGAFTSLTSSDTTVVRVLSSDEAAGTAVFRALRAGKATLKARCKSKTVSVKVTVADPYVATGISLPGSTQTLPIDQVLTLTPELTPKSAQDAVTWSSSRPKVATVKDGVVTPLDEGTTVITAKLPNGKKDKVKVKVKNPYKPTGIAFERKTLAMNVGQRLTLTPVIRPENYITTLTWSSSKTRVATVTDGVVEARAEGTATITVRTSNGKRARVTVRVTDHFKPQGVTFPNKTETVAVGQTLTLTPVLSPETAVTTYTWTTSKSRVATVTDGVVTGRSEGKATITVRTANGKKASVSVVVKDPYKPESVALTAQDNTVEVGQTLTLTAVLTPDNAVTTCTWKSSKSTIATVKNGVVTGKREGKAVITVETANGKEATFTVYVVKAADPVDLSQPQSVTLTPATLSLSIGDSVSLTAQVSPDTADPALTWSSSNERVALVKNGVVTGVNGGAAVITATTVNGLKAVCQVTVASTTEYRALLVGNDNFYNLNGPGSGWSRGVYNSKAVDRMKSMLNGVQGAQGGRYAVTTRIDLTLAMLKSAIAETFAGADENDVSLFYISSHGQLYSGHLVMASVTEKTCEYMAISTLRDCLLAVPGKVIVIIDTCGSGASIYLAKGARASTADPVAGQLADFDAGIVSAFADADPGVYESVPAPAEELDSAEGVVAKTGELRVSNKFYVLCSAAYNEESYAYLSGSFFTDWVTEGVGKSGSMPADNQYAGNKNGAVDLHELYKYVSGVGDNYKLSVGGVIHYQHVQVYPSDTRYELFG